MRAVPPLGWASLFLLVLVVCTCLVVVVQRSHVVEQSTAVELAVDHDAVVSLCRQVDYDVDLFWRRAVAAGATSIATRGITVAGLVDEGQAMVLAGTEVWDEIRLGGFDLDAVIHADRTYLLVSSELAVDIEDHLARLCGFDGYKKIEAGSLALFELAFTAQETENLQLMPINSNDRESSLSPLYLLGPVPRGLTGAVVNHIEMIGQAHPGCKIAFSSWTVPGYPQATEAMGRMIKDYDMQVAVLENHSQTGIEDIASAADYAFFRARIITPSDRAGSIALAARERQVRLFLISPTLGLRETDTAVDEWISLIERASREIREAGLVPGAAAAFPVYRVQPWALFLAGCGVGVGTFAALYLCKMVGKSPLWVVLGLVLTALSGLIAVSGFAGREVVALAAACVFPVIATLAALRVNRRFWSIVPVVVCLLVAVSGGLIITVLLGDSAWALKVRQFRGVKLAYALPPLIVLWPWVMSIVEEQGGIVNLLRQRLWRSQITVGTSLIGIVVLGCAAFYVGRSGHDSGLPVSSVEVMVRGLLEQILAVRPRTKEFLLGFPALVIAWKLQCRQSKWAMLWAAIGCIAPVSVLNSFSHLHTPVSVTVWRSVIGAIIGLSSGAIVIFGFDRLFVTGGSTNHEKPLA